MIYMYKKDLALDDLQGLMSYKIQPINKPREVSANLKK